MQDTQTIKEVAEYFESKLAQLPQSELRGLLALKETQKVLNNNKIERAKERINSEYIPLSIFDIPS